MFGALVRGVLTLLIALPFPVFADALAGAETFFSFAGPAEGDQMTLPNGEPAIGPDGALYGALVYGGPNATGSVYKISPEGVKTNLHTFAAVDSNYANIGGAYPQGSVVFGPDGNLYGTTVYGGLNGTGTIYKIVLNGKFFATLHEFTARDAEYKNMDGAFPYVIIPGDDGYLYGSADRGGAGALGLIYRITPTGLYNVIHTFGAFEGRNAEGWLINPDGYDQQNRMRIGPDGNFYGTTMSGGHEGGGVLYQMTKAGALTVLHHFSHEYGMSVPQTLTFRSDGVLFGTTFMGGQRARGTIFKYTPARGVEEVFPFGLGQYQGNPMHNALLEAEDGAFYVGQSNMIARLLPDQGRFETIHDLRADGYNYLGLPASTMVRHSDGYFYGTAGAGGTFGYGGIYRFQLGLQPLIQVSITPDTIRSGEAAMMTWNAPGMDLCTRRGGGINTEELPASGSGQVNPTVAGIYFIELECEHSPDEVPYGITTVRLTVEPVLPVEPPPSTAASEGSGGAMELGWLLLLAVCSVFRGQTLFTLGAKTMGG